MDADGWIVAWQRIAQDTTAEGVPAAGTSAADADGRFAELAGLGRVELLVWDGQPTATRLADLAHHVHRITRPTGTLTDDAAGQDEPRTTRSLGHARPSESGPR